MQQSLASHKKRSRRAFDWLVPIFAISVFATVFAWTKIILTLLKSSWADLGDYCFDLQISFDFKTVELALKRVQSTLKWSCHPDGPCNRKLREGSLGGRSVCTDLPAYWSSSCATSPNLLTSLNVESLSLAWLCETAAVCGHSSGCGRREYGDRPSWLRLWTNCAARTSSAALADSWKKTRSVTIFAQCSASGLAVLPRMLAHRSCSSQLERQHAQQCLHRDAKKSIVKH